MNTYTKPTSKRSQKIAVSKNVMKVVKQFIF